MEKKIYEAFDSIKLDSTVKKDALNDIIKRGEKDKYKYKYINYRKLVYGVFIFGLFTLLIIINQKMATSNELNTNIDNVSGAESTNEMLSYQGDSYYLTNENASEFVLHNELGPLNEFIVSDVVKTDTNTYSDNEAIVYSSNDEDVLLVKKDDQILVYRKTNR